MKKVLQFIQISTLRFNSFQRENKSIIKKVALIILIGVGFLSHANAQQNNWDGDDPTGNFSDCNNWYSNTCPSTWNGGQDLYFNVRNSLSQTSMFQDIGWQNVHNIIYATTFTTFSIPLNTGTGGSQYGFNFYGKVENQCSGAQTINLPLSGRGNPLEIDPTNADLTLNNPVYNDNAYNINVYGSNSHVLYLNSYIVGGSGNSLNILQYSKVAIGFNMASQTNPPNSATNTAFGGGVNINIGELWFMPGGTLNGGTVTVGTGNTNVAKVYLNNSTGGLSISNALSVPSGSSNSYIGGLNTSGTNTYSGTVALSGPSTFEVNSGGTLNMSGIMSGSGAVSVGIVGGTGSGAIVQFGNASNSYTGNTTINSGATLQIAADGDLGGAPGSVSAANITLSGGTLGIITNSFTLTTNRGITLTSSTASGIDVASGKTLTWGGSFSGSGSLAKLNSGTFNITTTAGGTYAGLGDSAGVVRIASTTAGTQMLGNVTVGVNGTLRMGNTNMFGAATLPPPFITVNGTFDATDNSTGNYAQAIALQGGSNGAINMGTAALTISNTNTTGSGDIYNGHITGSGGLVKTNTGIETLGNANTSLTGNVTVGWGTLAMGNANGINNTNSLTLGDAANHNATLSTGSYNVTVTSVTTTGTGTETINNNSASAGSITVNNSSSDMYGGILTNGSSGTLALTKAGTDTLTLTGTSNAYTGTTTITAGTLKLGVNNAIGGSSPIKLNGGNLSISTYSDAFSTLQVAANSSIELTAGTPQTISFANSTGGTSWAGTLTIYHWVGTPGPSGGFTAGNTKITVPVGGFTPTQLALINFSGYATGAAITATGELVPAVLNISGISVAFPGSCSTNCSGYVGNTITISGSNLSTVTTVKVGATYGTATTITAGTNWNYNSGANTITFTAVTGASGFVFVNDGTSTASSTSTYTDLGYLANSNGNWTAGGTWFNGVAPATTVDVTIAANVVLNTSPTISSLIINSGKTFTSSDATARTLSITNNTTGASLNNNGGTWANGTGTSTVIFSGSVTQTISGTVGFNNLTTNAALNPGTATTVNGTLTLNSGGSISTNAVAYGSAATLYYNEGGGSGAKINTTVNEWPNTGAVNIYIDNNTWIQIFSSKIITGNLYVNSGALQSNGANTLTMNKSGTDTITVKNGNGTPGAIYGTDNGVGNDLTLTIASGNTTVFTGDAGTSNDDNKKFVAVNVNGTLRLQRGIVVYYGGFAVGSAGTLQIDANGYIQAAADANSPFPASVAPTYASGALLKYNSNTTYGRGLEWNAAGAGTVGTTAGYPYNVEIAGSTGTTLNLGNGSAGTARQCAGKLTIDANSAMSLDASSMTAALTVLGNIYINGTLTLSSNGTGGGDIHLGGNWYRSNSTGTFTPNGRSVFFDGANNSYITVGGGGTETFAYLRENLSVSGKNLKPNNNLPDTTNIVINGTAGNVLNLTGSGGLDINGRKISIDHSDNPTTCSCSSPTVWIYVDLSRTVTDSAASGEFKFKSSANPNQPIWYTCSVHNNSGTGTLTFDNKTLVSIADGAVDFGYSSGSITTIQGVMQVKLGGSVGQTFNSCVYSTASILRFANDIDYQVYSVDKTWAAGSSGAGVPSNIDVNDAGTNLTLDAPRSITGNITITNGTLTLTPSSGNTFNVAGNWSRTGSSSSFVNDANAKVVFNGTSAQTITCTANSNTETFREVEIANTGSSGSNTVTLSGSTTLLAADSIIFTSGVLTTGSNMVVVPDTSIVKANASNTNYTVSWVNGTMKRFFTSGSTSTWAFPVGDASHGHLATVKSNTLTGISYFTATFGAIATGGNNVNSRVNAWETSIPGTYHTAYTAINSGGSWIIEPDATPASGTYDVSLYFTASGGGFTGLADNQFGILKRAISSPASTDYAYFKPAGGTLNATGGLGRTVAGGYALRLGLSTFSEFAIGEANTVLPITLVSFTGQNEGGVNALAWTTATQSNTDHFSIQRSPDANLFAEIGTVKAAGFSVNTLNYNFVDDNPFSGINYYRLGTVDQDGQIEYSNIIAVSTAQLATNTVLVYPNPVAGDISFDVNTSASSVVNYTLTDVLGRVIQTGQLSTSTGVNHYQIPGSGLTHGVYFLNVSNVQMGLSKTTRLIKAE